MSLILLAPMVSASFGLGYFFGKGTNSVPEAPPAPQITEDEKIKINKLLEEIRNPPKLKKVQEVRLERKDYLEEIRKKLNDRRKRIV